MHKSQSTALIKEIIRGKPGNWYKTKQNKYLNDCDLIVRGVETF